VTADDEELEYPYPKDWVWGKSGPLSGVRFPKADAEQVHRFIAAHSGRHLADLEAELQGLDHQLTWRVFLPRRVIDQIMIFYVLGFVVVIIVSLPLMAVINGVFGADSGSAALGAASLAWGVAVLWRMTQERQRLVTRRDDVARELREQQRW